jgi:hypothetical protein
MAAKLAIVLLLSALGTRLQLWTKVIVFRLRRILSREVEEIKTLESLAMIEHQAQL